MWNATKNDFERGVVNCWLVKWKEESSRTTPAGALNFDNHFDKDKET